MSKSKKKKSIKENINKSRNVIKVALFILIVLGLGVGFLILRSTTLLFNNVNEAEQNKINTAINNYIEKRCDTESKSPSSKCFSSNKIYLVETIVGNGEVVKEYSDYDNFYYAYSWIVDSNFVKKNNIVEEESGSSIPTKVLLGKKGDTYTVLKTEIPRDGSYYSEDLKKLFPFKIRNKMNNAQVDGTVSKLLKDNKTKAEEYFK